MPILRIVLTLLIVLGSLTAKCQTFLLNGSDYIGKTRKEIIKINEANKNKFLLKKRKGLVTKITFADTLNGVVHTFFFARRSPFACRLCASYLVKVDNQTQFEQIKTELLIKCKEASVNEAVQVSGTEKYIWNYGSNGCSNYRMFSVKREYSKHHK